MEGKFLAGQNHDITAIAIFERIRSDQRITINHEAARTHQTAIKTTAGKNSSATQRTIRADHGIAFESERIATQSNLSAHSLTAVGTDDSFDHRFRRERLVSTSTSIGTDADLTAFGCPIGTDQNGAPNRDLFTCD